jgi:hypothetical protein
MRVPARSVGFWLLVTVVCCVGCISLGNPENLGEEWMSTFVVRSTTPDLIAVVGYRYAALNPGEEWLLLDLAVSSPIGQSAEIERSMIFIRTPSGTRIPLATQSEFLEDFGVLRSVIRRANIMRDGILYFRGGRVNCLLRFFVEPNRGLTYDRITVDSRRVCQGRVFFKVPGGVQPGRWTLGIDLQESSVRIPLPLVSPQGKPS